MLAVKTKKSELCLEKRKLAILKEKLSSKDLSTHHKMIMYTMQYRAYKYHHRYMSDI